MATVHIAFEVNNGRILSMHYVAGEADDAQHSRRRTAEQARLADDQVDVISLPAEDIHPQRFYRVDVRARALVEAHPGTPDEGAVRFAAGGGRAPERS
jgi:hypothetical protein